MVASRRVVDAIQCARELLVERRSRLRRSARRAAALAAHDPRSPRRSASRVGGAFPELIFADPELALSHLPPAQRGMLAPPSIQRTRQIREKLALDLKRGES